MKVICLSTFLANKIHNCTISISLEIILVNDLCCFAPYLKFFINTKFQSCFCVGQI